MDDKKTGKGWFNSRCKAYRDKFRLISKRLSKEPFNRVIRDKFVKARSEYKKQCRKSEKEHTKFLTKKLIDLEQCDPRNFWILIGKMNNWGKEKIDPAGNLILRKTHTLKTC